VLGTLGKFVHQTRGILIGCLPAKKKMMMMIQKGMQSLHLHKKHQNFKRFKNKLVSRHSVNSMEFFYKRKNTSIVKLPGSSNDKKYFQCKIAVNRG